MKKTPCDHFRNVALAVALPLLTATTPTQSGQAATVAYVVPAATNGNQAVKGLIVGNDFYVLRPIRISEFGVFDHLGDGIQGEAVLVVQLFARNGNEGTLLETMTFDATAPGQLRGGQRFKTLPAPVTLLPGAYTIAASGFDDLNREGNAGNRPYVSNTPPWQVDGGGGLIRFEGGGRYGTKGVNLFPNYADGGPPDRYAAGTFVFSEAADPTSPFEQDYAVLTAGVASFPADCCLGSVAVFGRGAFPVLAEPGGRRFVVAAAGRYDGKWDGARCVTFAHTQFATAANDSRAVLFDNAILWAGRQASRGQTVVGVGPGVDATRLAGLGYVVKAVTTNMATAETDLSNCSVFVLDMHLGETNDIPQTGFTPEAVAQIMAFNAAGGGLVMVATPWAISYMVEHPAFALSRQLLGPFGLAYRDSQIQPADPGFTNIALHPWPVHLSAFPAADLLRQDRAGTLRLSGYDKMTALGAINYTLSARPDLLCDLTSACQGQPFTGGAGLPSGFVDFLSQPGAAASTNRLGQWVPVNGTLEARDRRGAVSFSFVLPAGDVYRLSVEGGNTQGSVEVAAMPLQFSVDGIPVGSGQLMSTNGANAVAECMLPWLPAGEHTMRIYWDNAANLRTLRLTRVAVQVGLGGDIDGDGKKDWVAGYVRASSGLDNTNTFISSFTSPVCIEGRDPYLPALRCWVGSPGSEPRSLAARLGPDRRWFAEVPLTQDPLKRVTLEVSFQNGGLTEMRQIQWLPLDLLTATNLTIRRGDSLLFTVGTAPKARGEMAITAGTNQLPDLDGLPVPYAFNEAGQFTVTGAWAPPGGSVQSRSITVNVVGFKFPSEPVCWVGRLREWDVTNMPPELVLETDSRLMWTEIVALSGNGRRYGLFIDDKAPRAILGRLGPGGPVLDSVTAQGTDIESGAQTYNHVVAVYGDGSQLVETLIVSSLLPPGVSIKLSIIVGGVTFEDGTTEKWLTAADFDELGQCRLRFLKAPGVTTSNCHTLEFYQGGELIGSR